jgi:hypothetical protein
MTPPITPCDDLPAEVDFAAGRRGQFFRAEARVSLPLHHDANQDTEPPGADP